GSSPPNWSSIASKQGIMYKQTINDGSCIWQVLSTTFTPGWEYAGDLSPLSRFWEFYLQENNRYYIDYRSPAFPQQYTTNPVIECELDFKNPPTNYDLHLFGSTDGSRWNYIVYIPSGSRNIVFGLHDSGNSWRATTFGNFTLSNNTNYLIRVEFNGSQARLYINNNLVQTNSFNYAVQNRSGSYVQCRPFSYTANIKWVKLYSGSSLIGHWDFTPIINGLSTGMVPINFVSNIYSQTSDNYLGYNVPNQNQSIDVWLFPERIAPFYSTCYLIGGSQQDRYRPLSSIRLAIHPSHFYSVNFKVRPYNTSLNFTSAVGLSVWNALTPTEYFIQGNSRYFIVVTKTGDATHCIYCGDYFPFYPLNLDGYIPVTLFSFQRENQPYQATASLQHFIADCPTPQYVTAINFVRITDNTLLLFDDISRPIFPIVFGNSTYPFGHFYNMYHVLGYGLSLMTYIQDVNNNDYIVFREVTNNAWHQWYAVKIE
ncbi:MAG: hypothetical protein QXO77_02810, partial [Saccharolobus sp.]